MNVSELKAKIESRGTESHFFDRKTMRFFGDTMRNFGARKVVIKSQFDSSGTYHENGIEREVWELYRKRPVKAGNQSSAYFDVNTFNRVFSMKGE